MSSKKEPSYLKLTHYQNLLKSQHFQRYMVGQSGEIVVEYSIISIPFITDTYR